MARANKSGYIRRQKRRLERFIPKSVSFRALQDFKAKYGDDGMAIYRASVDMLALRPDMNVRIVNI